MKKWTGGIRRAAKAKKKTKEMIQREFFQRKLHEKILNKDEEITFTHTAFNRLEKDSCSLDLRSLISTTSFEKKSNNKPIKRKIEKILHSSDSEEEELVTTWNKKSSDLRQQEIVKEVKDVEDSTPSQKNVNNSVEKSVQITLTFEYVFTP